ncbi:N-acetyl-gamma-glutamyl-phosphate reductase [Polynucleobacter paneuropaeus]|uniref:N-acetyl-gamma-glutamyl-phosphate reductase n=1 Tax=Polynucleobacter paludilacus TaxID=1855895 RepID=UPI001BFD63D6|nr:N-acetyl-gamma-glutamyl-phosphate reductase [Polynucleobacter paludilacus]QWD17689.1 N-acetyl-gamma-glutamyl-phosphate reductase [Polynucleobacter paneuropaeus]QWD86839.1 N-acetyl-gamma-glutamyl-phosphate reductase [Polynucleobacter paludilacus]
MIKVGIVGGTGYTGVELLRLLTQHPEVQIQAITSRTEAGMPVADMFPSLRGRVDLKFTTPEDANLTECDAVFFATPHGVAMAQAKALLAAGVKVLDLAADFRLKDVAEFQKWYGMEHSCPDVLAEAVYGLPEINRDAIQKARVVGLAGCYPTSVQLGLAPLLSPKSTGGKQLIDGEHIISDSKSGTSGAGRKAEIGTLMAEASDNFKAYGVKGHRHLPEIVQGLKAIAGHEQIGLTFVPHLTPMIRGIHSTLYVRLTEVGKEVDYQKLYENYYKDEPFVDVMPAGSHPETRSVRGSNGLRIAIHRPGNGDTLVILVVEDNLVKGASGQGVQCLNLMFGLPETMGLTQIALLP